MAQLSQLITTQESGSQTHLTLGKEASRLRASFKQDGKVLGKQISVASEAIHRKWSTAYDIGHPVPSRREKVHVFGADRTDTGGPEFYRLMWGLIDGFSGAGIRIRSSLRDGTFWALHFATGSNQRSSYAGIAKFNRIVPFLSRTCLNALLQIP